MSETFLVITGTVTFYGLTSKSIAQWLGLARDDAQGVVIAGSHSWALEIAEALDTLGFPVEIIAQDPMDVAAAHRAGIQARHGSAASHELVEKLDLSGYGTFLALTATDEVNFLGSMEFADAFGRENVFHLEPRIAPEDEQDEPAAARRRGRVVFGEPMTYDKLNGFFRRGGELRIVTVTERETFEEFCEQQEEVFGMCYVRDGRLHVRTTDVEYTPQSGDTIVCGVRSSRGSEE